MLKFYNCIEKLKDFLKEHVYKFKIIVNIDTTLSVRVVSNDRNIIDKIENFCDTKIYVEEFYDKKEYEEDEFLKKSLNNDIDWTYKKRFDSFNYYKKIDFDIPIVSFYSYKGGVGRTTSLIAFASYFSNIKNKNVVILDFDFEAPGIINFFDIDFQINPKNGIIEFILDSQSFKKDLNFKEYFIEVSKRFSGGGNIYVIPAGNIFDLENIKSYIEGLSRIDINSAETILDKINNLLNTIKKDLSPDLILIDSRTGFSDIFGLLSHSLSDLVVGFFTNNKQNTPGLEIFLELMNKKNSPEFIIVNSQIHFDRGFNKKFLFFKNKVSQLFGETLANITYIERVPTLIELGSENEDSEEFIDFIKNKYQLTNYKQFFDLIEDSLDIDKNISDYEVVTTLKNKNTSDIIKLKKDLLQKIQNNYPKLYAEDTEIKYDEDFLKRDFYIRICMEDIFNVNKFLLIGGKGSGKTAFYNALKNNNFVDHLQRKANKLQQRFIFIDIVSLKNDKNKNKYFPIEQIENFRDKDIRFYQRFWQLYIINSLALEQRKIKAPNEEFNFTFESIEFNDKQKSKIEKFINEYTNEKFELVEEEFLRLDNFLKKWDINLMITFDQLDFIVPPNFWDRAIVPLINFAKSNSYYKIYPKLFIRRDLFEKLSGLTNKESLRDSNNINLEWNKDEIFGFFFKIVFAYSKEEFFKIMELYNGENARFIKPIKNEIDKKYNQIPLEKYYLDPLIETFFGKYAFVGKDKFKRKKFGYMYDWFYTNLKNADDTISLRPFLDLIKEAIKRYLKSNKFDNFKKPILPPQFHTNKDVRKIAVKKHFEDLANETGNEDFKKIIEHIKKTASSFPKEFRKRVLEGKTYEEFLEYLLTNLNLNANNINEIEEILIINGVLKVDFIKSNYKKAEFAFLYKYYLGLSG